MLAWIIRTSSHFDFVILVQPSFHLLAAHFHGLKGQSRVTEGDARSELALDGPERPLEESKRTRDDSTHIARVGTIISSKRCRVDVTS